MGCFLSRAFQANLEREDELCTGPRKQNGAGLLSISNGDESRCRDARSDKPLGECAGPDVGGLGIEGGVAPGLYVGLDKEEGLRWFLKEQLSELFNEPG